MEKSHKIPTGLKGAITSLSNSMKRLGGRFPISHNLDSSRQTMLSIRHRLDVFIQPTVRAIDGPPPTKDTDKLPNSRDIISMKTSISYFDTHLKRYLEDCPKTHAPIDGIHPLERNELSQVMSKLRQEIDNFIAQDIPLPESNNIDAIEEVCPSPQRDIVPYENPGSLATFNDDKEFRFTPKPLKPWMLRETVCTIQNSHNKYLGLRDEVLTLIPPIPENEEIIIQINKAHYDQPLFFMLVGDTIDIRSEVLVKVTRRSKTYYAKVRILDLKPLKLTH